MLPRVTLTNGKTYIIDESQSGLSVELFQAAVLSGRAGLYISSEPKEHVRAHLTIEGDIDTAWVTDVSAPGALRPAMLDQINALRERFLSRHPKTVILLDIFNTLTCANEFSNVFKFFNYLRDDAHNRDSIILISLDSRAMDASRFRMVRRLAKEVFSEDSPPEAFLKTVSLKEGRTYIFTSGVARAYAMAVAAFGAGRPVLCLVREFPDSVREARALPPEVKLIWLTRTGHPMALRPSDMSMKVAGALEKGRSVVLLDGFDILLAEMGFNELYRIMSHMKDLARVSGGNLLIHAPRTSLSAEELRKLSQGAETV